jgi:1-acyl-sn-glycerol-3-phosphate acyltransferase
VYVSNHASLFDIPVIAAGVPDKVRIIYKKELERIPVFGWGLKAGAYIAINRQRGVEAMQALDEAAERIRTGTSVILYAEGTRTLTGSLQPFKRGAFNLALRAGVPVIPLTINGTFHILPKHSISVRPGTVHLILDAPIPPTPERGRDAEIRLMEKVHTAIAHHYVDQSVNPDGSHFS